MTQAVWFSHGPMRHRPYMTIRELKWDLGRKGSGLTVTVPPGFHFGMSVPQWLTWLIDPDNPRYQKAACLHDYALEELHFDRVTSAALFADALRSERVPGWVILFMTFAVIAWNWKF